MYKLTAYSLLLVLLLFSSCSSKQKDVVKVDHEDSKLKTKTDEIHTLEKRDSLPNILFDDVEFNTIAKWYYANTIVEDDGSVIGIYHGDEFPGEYWDEEYVSMTPFHYAEYTEDGKKKAAVLFEGAISYMHGHTESLVEVLFFEQENKKWKFLDSLRFEDYDIGETEKSNLCKTGFSIHIKSEWANMGAVSSSESFFAFQHEKLVAEQYFWTYSGHFNEEEPYEMVGEDSAKVVVKENPSGNWNFIYYYGTHKECSQSALEDNVGYCSSKWIFENGKYKVKLLGKNEKQK